MVEVPRRDAEGTLVEGVNVKPLAYDSKEWVVSIGCLQ